MHRNSVAGKPTRDKNIPGTCVNGQKGRKKGHVCGIIIFRKRVFPGLSNGAGGRMRDIHSIKPSQVGYQVKSTHGSH